MTAARPQRKVSGWFGLVIVANLMAPVSALGQTSERTMADWRTGLALSGFDPVAYFTDAAPKIGRPDYEYSFAGVTWRFRNEGNRAAFKQHPDTYMPRFGGHDPVAVGRGVARPGHPEVWLINEQRLYLFYSPEARAAFEAAPEQSQDAAEEKWPDVVRTLAR